MKNLGKLLLLVIFINSWLFANVVTKVSNQSIIIGDMVTVTIEASGASVEFPDDISAILGYPVENMGTSTQSSYSWINGTQKSTIKKALSFNFYPDKNITIPPFEVKVNGKVEKTNSVDIEVSRNAKQGSSNNAFKIEIEASKKSVMVGEPLSVVMKFYRKASLDVKKLDYTPPRFTNFEVNDKESKEMSYRKGDFVVQELRYTIYPKKDGNLTISPAIIKVATPASNNNMDMFRLFAPVKWSKAVSNSINIEVKPIPNGASLVGEFNILSTIDKTKTEANKPIKLQIQISGNGSLDTLREINYNIDGVTIFSDDADVKSSFNKSGEIISRYKKSFVFIGDGNFSIPQKEIVYYNKAKAKLDKLIIPKYDIEVTGGEAKVSSVVTPTKEIKPKVIIKEVEKHTELSQLILFFMLGVISTLAVLYILPLIKNYKRDNFYSNEKALKILYANMEKSLEIEDIVRDLYAQKAGDKSVSIDKKRIKEIIDELQKD
ncbi:BatD [hydrothermal vent metagenome]|uniref:BatD n=1 Tax=hydrothermal vent metagenome TaxID=652676 RepID=A0A1W1EJ23_9ZZZZ